jgi:hypothetical protein
MDGRTSSVILMHKRVVRSSGNAPSVNRRVKSDFAEVRPLVDEFLSHIGAQRLEPMWALTTREHGMETLIRDLWEFKNIKARQVLGNRQNAVALSNRFKDNSGRERVLQFFLVKRGGKWLIDEMVQDSPENAQRRIEGFMVHPGVVYDVRVEDLTGEWSSLLGQTRYTLNAEGAGKSEGNTSKDFHWELNGDKVRFIHSADEIMEGKVVRLEDDMFALKFSKNSQSSYHRVKREKK